METIFSAEDLDRVHDAADVIWGKNEPMPDEEIEKVREEVMAIICGSWRHGEVSRYPQLRAILEVGGGFPSPRDLNYAECFSRGIRVLSCAPAFAAVVAEMGLGLALACARQIAWTDQAFRRDDPNWSHTSFETEVGNPFTLYGKQVGFIGFGSLARALKPLIDPFGCPIQVYDPWLTDAYLRKQNVVPTDLDTLLSTSRVIFVLAVPTASNRALSGPRKIRPDPFGCGFHFTQPLARGRFRCTDRDAAGRALPGRDRCFPERTPTQRSPDSPGQTRGAFLTPRRDERRSHPEYWPHRRG